MRRHTKLVSPASGEGAFPPHMRIVGEELLQADRADAICLLTSKFSTGHLQAPRVTEGWNGERNDINQAASAR